MKIKTSELIGPGLDWAVAKCEGKSPSLFIYRQTGKLAAEHNYSTDWAQGGPIIDCESITTIRCEDAYRRDRQGFTTSKRIPVWGAAIGHQGTEHVYGAQGDDWGVVYSIDEDEVVQGPTALIAAMRCYVASKLGDEVDVPEELLK